MKYLILTLIILNASSTLANEDTQKTKIILLGVFHFHNPGADAAKFGDVDILSEKPQKEIELLSQKIALLKPDKIMLESDREGGLIFNEILSSFSAQTLLEHSNEIVQIGFRLKSKLERASIHYVDHVMGLPFDSLISTWQMSGQQKYFEEFMGFIKKVEDDFNRQTEQGVSIIERLKLMNTDGYRNFSLAPYTSPLIMNAGAEGNYIGADVASEWYRRNIRIFSNIVRDLNGEEECVFIMFGASHIPILEHLFRLHSEKYELIDVVQLLSD
ncbi:MAG: hypothetical protein JJU28_05710 [Cyclobacteriaceae bacterium]|nr:hypothetical protein [Cyclobacteriaceae bacterium]